MSFTQLQQPIPLFVIGKGKGTALAVIDYGPEHNLIWVTAIDETGELWCAPNPKVRMQANWTLQRDRSPAETLCSEEDSRAPVQNGRSANGNSPIPFTAMTAQV